MWLFLSIFIIILTGFYIFVQPFRQGFNNLIEGILIWLFGQAQNMPQWARSFIGWLNRTRSTILAGVVWATVRLLWLLGVLTVLYFYAVSHAQETGDNTMLLVVMFINAALLLAFLQVSSTVSGFIPRVFNTSREFTRTLATVFMIYSLHVAMLLHWSELYLAYMWYIIGITVLATAFFQGLAIHNNKIGAWTGRLLVVVFIAINVTPLISPELVTLATKRGVSIQKQETGKSGFDVEKTLATTRVPLLVKMDASFISLDGVTDDSVSVNGGEVVQVVNGDAYTNTGIPVKYVEKFVSSKLVAKGYLPLWVIDFDSSPDEWTNKPKEETKDKTVQPETVTYKEYKPSPWLILDGMEVGPTYKSIYNKWSNSDYRPKPGQQILIYPYIEGMKIKLGSAEVRVTKLDNERVRYGHLDIIRNVTGDPLLIKTSQLARIDSIRVYTVDN